MNIPRQFLNLVLHSSSRAVKSLHRVNLARQSFFNPAPVITTNRIDRPEPAVAQDSGSWMSVADANENNKLETGALKTGILRIPGPSISFSATAVPWEWNLDCLPLVENKVVCVDQSARAVLYDSEECQLVTMPSLHMPKKSPISLSIIDTKENSGCRSLYVMEKTSSGFPCHQFEAFIQIRIALTNEKVWVCYSLPLPPCFCDGKQKSKEIISYALVGGGSQICISVEDCGTYCFDTLNDSWSHVGKWTLPFFGKAEYVPELKLWFGLSAKAQHLCAADLSTVDSMPRVVNTWKELNPPEVWQTTRDSELINLGSGRFCIARFFKAATTKFSAAVTSDDSCSGNETPPLYDSFAVITGVEVVPSGSEDKHIGNGSCNSSDDDGGNYFSAYNGNSGGSGNDNGKGLRMVKHKSRRHTYTGGTNIDSIF